MSCDTCFLIGILDDGWSGLNETAHRHIGNAKVIIGAARTLALVSEHAPQATLRDMDGALASVPEWLREAESAGQHAVVLATGDPFCHGFATWLTGKLGKDAFTVLPAVSTLQLACARFSLTWQDMQVASCHGPDAGEWVVGAPPTHGLYGVLRAITLHPRVALFTSPANTPARLARALLAAGFGDDVRLSVACCLLMPDEKCFARLSLQEVAGRDFAQPNVVIVERQTDTQLPAFGLEDDEYVQRSPEKGLITKQEVRALSLARLRLRPDATVWDIGAGSGSVGLEAARLVPHGHVWAIEKNAADADNARVNALHLRTTNYTLINAKAPAGLKGWPDPDAVFIGGSGGELAELIILALTRLKPGGRLVMNFVTLENLATATQTLQNIGSSWNVVQLQAARSQPILSMHRMAAQNPVWLITARKEANA